MCGGDKQVGVAVLGDRLLPIVEVGRLVPADRTVDSVADVLDGLDGWGRCGSECGQGLQEAASLHIVVLVQIPGMCPSGINATGVTRDFCCCPDQGHQAAIAAEDLVQARRRLL
jgi:hypothetical protein